MDYKRLLLRGASSSFSDGSSKRRRRLPYREISRTDLKEPKLPEEFKQRLLTYSRGHKSKGIDDLSPVILYDIISRLPLESIFESSLVCRKLYQVTRDPDFISRSKLPEEFKKRLLSYKPKPRFILQPLVNVNSLNHLALVDKEGEVRKIWQISVTKQISRQFKIMCSYNGLLCMAPRDRKPDPLCIYNPLTRTFLELPGSEFKRVLSDYVVCLLSASNGRYKIVRHYTQKYGAKESRFEILSLGESSWRLMSGPGPNWSARRSIFHNGVLFIVMQKVHGLGMCCTMIDVNDEKIQIIHFKEELHSHPSVVEFLEIERRLNIMKIFKNEQCFHFIYGKKVGEFSLARFGPIVYCPHPGRAKKYLDYRNANFKVKEDKYLKRINWDRHYVMFSSEETWDNSSGIEYKMFDYTPSFVDPNADALLSWPVEQDAEPQAQS